MIAAELGYEVAQSNVAWLLDRGTISWRMLMKGAYAFSNASETARQALIHWNRAANQGDLDARVKMGDLYYYGTGTDVDYAKSASYYRVAESQMSSLAMFNLGYMHERGIGIPQVRPTCGC
jgi:SEL1 protein